MKTIIAFIVSLTFFSSTHAQHLFPEKFSGCVTDRFALEFDKADAKVDDADLLRAITAGFDEKTRSKISGSMMLQILVDVDGKSCLLSAKNHTNIRTKKLALKENIDSKLLWDTPPSKKVAAIVVVNFSRDGMVVKRLGVNANRGLHELKG